MDYDHFEHRHRFSVWAAARATQRGFTSVANLRDALKRCEVHDYVKKMASASIDAKRFKQLHRGWCRSIIDHLQSVPVHKVTFGRAAKLVAVYLKSMIVLGPSFDTDLARVAHPPIDRILLQNLAKEEGISAEQRARWKGINWTVLDENSYYNLVDELRAVVPEHEPFWMLERHWTVTNEQTPS